MGIAALALTGFGEGLVALMVAPVFDRILKPDSLDSRLPLVKLPFNGHTIYLNSFMPRTVHYVGAVFAISFIVIHDQNTQRFLCHAAFGHRQGNSTILT